MWLWSWKENFITLLRYSTLYVCRRLSLFDWHFASSDLTLHIELVASSVYTYHVERLLIRRNTGTGVHIKLNNTYYYDKNG